MAAVVPAVSMVGITKRFPGVVANDHVDFEAAAGEVHALLGENGAGKTTLSNVLTGLYRPDEGEIRLFGEPMSFESPRDAIDAGVCMVHQHFRLVERFTVAENLILGDRRGAGSHFVIDPRAVEGQVQELGERYELSVDPRAHVWQLSVGEQQRVAILNALYQNARVLLLDEPTAVLTPDEADRLFVTLRQMAAEGRTVIFISHKLHEVKAVSDRVTVLRAGRKIGTVETATATEGSMAALMIGHDLNGTVRRAPTSHPGAPVLSVVGLTADGDRGLTAVRDVSLEIRPGEIVGVAGVAGNGQRELAEAITGLRPATRGSVSVAGRLIEAGDPRAAVDAGIRYIPEDRLGTGLSPGLSIGVNLAMRRLKRFCLGPFVRLRAVRANGERAIRDFDIRCPGPDAAAGTLSGGNLQKIVIAREFSDAMNVLVAASPTRGLDVAAVESVHKNLLDAADGGAGVLLVSEDLDEILALADRVVVMYEGRLSEVPDRDDIAEISLRMAGVPGSAKAAATA